jgi:hypothetical protein
MMGVEFAVIPKSETPRFELGRIVATQGVLTKANVPEITEALLRHARGDWGDVGEEDREENELSLAEGLRLLSSYRTESQEVFWIITEWDRSLTTVLLPSEY